MSDHRIRSEKFGIDHRRAGAFRLNTSMRPVARNSGTFFAPWSETRRKNTGKKTREEGAGSGRRVLVDEELGPSRLIRGLADADIHIACRRRHIYWHLYALPLKHCSFGGPRRGSPQMNKVFRALGVPLAPTGPPKAPDGPHRSPPRFLRRCAWTFTAPTILHCRFANDRCRNYARDPTVETVRRLRFVRVSVHLSSFSATFFRRLDRFANGCPALGRYPGGLPASGN